jgi:hypothetical protein
VPADVASGVSVETSSSFTKKYGSRIVAGCRTRSLLYEAVHELLFVPIPLRYIALIPAAGVGIRLRHDVPKQYLRLGERTMLEHSISAMLSDARIDRVFVVVAPTDDKWQSIQSNSARVEFLQRAY